MPIQAPQWTEFLSCPVCCNEFDASHRSPVSLGCAHTICKTCLSNLHKKQCPFDQTAIKADLSGLPVNGALLQLVCQAESEALSGAEGLRGQELQPVPQALESASLEEIQAYKRAVAAIQQLALYLRPQASGGGWGMLSRPMQRKLVSLVNCQLVEEEGRWRGMRAARSLGDRTVTELILHHQNPQHLSANLWAAVRARGCQFLGPAMQEEVLMLVLLALEDGSALSRKVLVMFVVQRLEPHFPQASKTSIGHVVQLLYRASCFKVSKREGDSSLMQLKEEFRSYEALRREHDAQIVQIATEAGLRIAPDQWSALLYGDTSHKSHMQSIIDKLQSPQSFAQSVQELVIALQRTNDPGNLSSLRPHLELLAAIDLNPDVVSYSMIEVAGALEACQAVVSGLVDFLRVHGGSKGQGVLGTSPGTNNLLTQPGTPGPHHNALCLETRPSCSSKPRSSDLPIKPPARRTVSLPIPSSHYHPHLDDDLDNKYHILSKHPKANNINHIINVFRYIRKPRKILNRNLVVTQRKDDDLVASDMFINEGGNNEYPGYPVPSAGFHYSSNNSHVFPAQSTTPTPYSPPPYHAEMYGNVPFLGGSYPEFGSSGLLAGHRGDAPTPPRQTTPTPKPWGQGSHLPNHQRPHSQPNARLVSSLAFLQHRKQELLNKIERVVATCNNNPVRSETHGSMPNFTEAYNNGSNIPRTAAEPHNYNCSTSFPNYYRSDSVLSEEEFIPFDPPVVSKYGPISRDGKQIHGMGEATTGLSMSLPGSYNLDRCQPGLNQSHTLSPPLYQLKNIPQSWLYDTPGYTPTSHVVQSGDSYPLSPPSFLDPGLLSQQHGSSFLPNNNFMPDNSNQEFLAESHKMKQQLRTLEKKIQDLQIFAVNGGKSVASEGEKLTQELHQIEKGLLKRERQLKMNQMGNNGSMNNAGWFPPWNKENNDNGSSGGDEPACGEDSYEAGIANDIRELELRWDFELQEQERRWSSQEDSQPTSPPTPSTVPALHH